MKGTRFKITVEIETKYSKEEYQTIEDIVKTQIENFRKDEFKLKVNKIWTDEIIDLKIVSNKKKLK